MEQLALFEEKVISNEIWDAHLIIKNLYNRNVSDTELFQRYFDFTCKVANWDMELETRSYFLDEASTALVVYTENAVIDAEQLMIIHQCRETIDNIRNNMYSVQNLNEQQYTQQVEANNHTILKDLVDLKGLLSRTVTQEEFDQNLLVLTEKENVLIKEELTNDQTLLYNNLTKEYSVLISDKLSQFAKASNTEYNRKAVRDFKYVIDAFKKEEGAYTKSSSKLYALVSSRLFVFDPARLFNETLIYYNHIYSYIFSKLDEEGKFKLTQIAIDTEKSAQ
ncbi:hypothetical protein L2089_15315 [Paenibacillus hunanensis]|uniref:hypothetical protein n=1 Tax=Paenibacillus hunanensis TaxID=539262 RepID=UPI002026190B|nr:hypothetical protein [Paenibacillus hunanensis]MCL9662062.1 hypothetical protein [Paenibacillus hunanensis]